jgi:PBP1b-binding outer membrane lipoprotein LpoB
MNKNIISVFLISFLIISCSNNEKQSINKNKKTVVVTNDKSDLPTIKKG